MILRTIGQSIPLEEKRRFLNPDACYSTKSARLEKKLAYSSADEDRMGHRLCQFFICQDPTMPKAVVRRYVPFDPVCTGSAANSLSSRSNRAGSLGAIVT